MFIARWLGIIAAGAALIGCIAYEPAPKPFYAISVHNEEFEDLRSLDSFFEGKRIVQLGENTHGAHEYNALKARFVRYLHEVHGFDVLVL